MSSIPKDPQAAAVRDLLRRYARARWEAGDPEFFTTRAPLLRDPAAATLSSPPPGARVLAGTPLQTVKATPQRLGEVSRPPVPSPVSARPTSPSRSGPAPTIHPSGIVNPAGSEEGKKLLEYYESIKGCTQCVLAKTRINFVFGTGSPKAEIVFVGEAPGEQEDKQGIPFVGPAGKLLSDLLAGIGLKREDVFIANVIKCRPPGNRKPELEEIQECEPYLFEQLRRIGPKLVVALGTFAAQSLLQTLKPIGQLRGRWVRWKDAELLATYHPSAGLRAGSFRKVIEEDFQLLQARLEKLRPGRA